MSYWWARGKARSQCEVAILAPATAILFLILTPVGAPAQPLNCSNFFRPAESTSFPFAWRGDRCEGFVEQKVSYRPASVKISYFGYGDLGREDTRSISNDTDVEIELRSELKSTNTFYRLVARLTPGRSIQWRYPDELKEAYGLRLDKIGMLAARPGARENVYRPFTVSGSRELRLGIVSSDFSFNSAEVIAYDGQHVELCRKTHDFTRVVSPLVQQTFALDLCGKDFAKVQRISVVAALKLVGRERQTSSRDVIWVEH